MWNDLFEGAWSGQADHASGEQCARQGTSRCKGPEVGRKHLCLRGNRRPGWSGEGKRVVGEIRGTDGDLWWKVSFLFWKTFESFWIGTWLNLNFLGKITLASGELICPDWTGRQGYHEEAPADSRRETGTMEAWTTGECVLSLSVKQPPSEVSQT